MDRDSLITLYRELQNELTRRTKLGGYSADANDITYIYGITCKILAHLINQSTKPEVKQKKKRSSSKG